MTTSYISQQGQEEFIFYSATTFRLLLDCLARPGKINFLRYPAFLGEPPRSFSNVSQADIPLNVYALAALLTLLDGETSFVIAADGQWLEPSAPASRWLALRSGAAFVLPDRADFALFCTGYSGGLLTALNAGSLLEPEMSTTALYCIGQLAAVPDGQEPGSRKLEAPDTGEAAVTIALSGPGIAEEKIIHASGLDAAEVALMQATRRSYPQGIDIYLVDRDGRCIGLPRTTKIRLLEQAEG